MAEAHRPAGRRFLFRGAAVALGGRLWDPPMKKGDELLPSQASVWLPITGGTETTRAESGFSFENIGHYAVRASHAESSVDGRYLQAGPDGAMVTVSTLIQDLHVRSGQRCAQDAHIVDVGEIRVELESRHTLRKGEESRISVKRFEITDMKIDLVDVVVRAGGVENKIKDHETARGLKQKMKTDATFKKHHMRFLDNPDHVSDGELIDRDPIVCTIVDEISIADPEALGATVDGNVIHLEGFGRIHIGELVISPSDRRLSALRFELGSPTEASITAGSGGTDGATWPP